jgi:hypothetical protein
MADTMSFVNLLVPECVGPGVGPILNVKIEIEIEIQTFFILVMVPAPGIDLGFARQL